MTSDDPIYEFQSFDHFLAMGLIPDGRFSILHEGVPVDFLYEPVENSKVTVILFHGSTKKDVDIPMHSGAGIMRGLTANRLAISDPSLTLDGSMELILSWFIGSSTQPALQHFLEQVIRRVKEVTGEPKLIFMGGSGGGFASLEMSRRFGGSLVLAMNPQTMLESYYPNLVNKYLALCWPGTASLRKLPPHVVHNIGDAYPKTLAHTVAYLQNTRDKHHIENHQIPFMERVGHSRNVFMLMDAWGDPAGKGHVQPPRDYIRNILETLVGSSGAWRSALLELGFTRSTKPQNVLDTVKRKNAGLPGQLVKDDM